MKRRGGAAIETALVFPLLLVMLAGIFEVGWYLHRRNMVSEAAAAAARAASVLEDPADVASEAETTVDARLSALGISTAGITVEASVVTGGVDAVQVEVIVPHTAFTGLIPVPSTIDVAASALFEDVGG